MQPVLPYCAVVVLLLGETRATFGTITPSQVVAGASTVDIASLAPIYWWRYMQWFLIAPASLAMLVSLLRSAEERVSATELVARGEWQGSRYLERVAVAAAQVMICFGATSTMYGPGTGPGRGVLFALGVAAWFVAFAAVSRAFLSAAALTPTCASLRWW